MFITYFLIKSFKTNERMKRKINDLFYNKDMVERENERKEYKTNQILKHCCNYIGESLHHKIVHFDNYGKPIENMLEDEEKEIDFLIVLTSIYRMSNGLDELLQKLKEFENTEWCYKKLSEIISKNERITDIGILAFYIEKRIEYFEEKFPKYKTY